MSTLDVHIDIACPWCWLGARHLELALDDLDAAARPTIRWRAYQLAPELPPEGRPAEEYFRARFGDLSALDEAQERITAMGADVGLAYRFDRRTVVANTFDAHRAIAVARDLGGSDDETAVVHAMFRATFELGLDTGSAPGLRAALDEAALRATTATAIAERLAAGDGADVVTADIEHGREIGVRGVPLYVDEQRRAISGAQPPQILRAFLAGELQPA